MKRATWKSRLFTHPDSIRKFARGIALTCNRGKRSVQNVIESIFSQFCDDSIFERSPLAKKRGASERANEQSIERERGSTILFDFRDSRYAGRGRGVLVGGEIVLLSYSFHTSFVLILRYQRKRSPPFKCTQTRSLASTRESLELSVLRITTSLYDICDFSGHAT